MNRTKEEGEQDENLIAPFSAVMQLKPMIVVKKAEMIAQLDRSTEQAENQRMQLNRAMRKQRIALQQSAER